jgi:hypothetical protein
MNPMARDALDRMLEAARAEPDPGKRRAVLDRAVQGIPRALYGPILNAIASPAMGSVEHDVGQAVFLRWAWQTPDFAANWAASAPPGPFRKETLAEAVGRWAVKSPDDAIRWTRELPADDRRWVFANAAHFMEGARPASAEAWQKAVEAEK